MNIYKTPDATLAARYNTIGETLPAIQSREAFAGFIKSDLELWKTTIAGAHISGIN